MGRLLLLLCNSLNIGFAFTNLLPFWKPYECYRRVSWGSKEWAKRYDQAEPFRNVRGNLLSWMRGRHLDILEEGFRLQGIALSKLGMTVELALVRHAMCIMYLHDITTVYFMPMVRIIFIQWSEALCQLGTFMLSDLPRKLVINRSILRYIVFDSS